MLELVFGSLVNNDPIWSAADNFLDRHLPGAEDAFSKQGDTERPHDEGDEFSRFDIEGKTQHTPQLPPGFSDHLAVDHTAVTLRIEVVAQRVGGINQDHIPHLADAVQRHPAGQPWQEAGEGVVAQADGHHFPTVDVDDHFTHNPQTTP